jgi:hypothetical protein
MNRKSPFGIHYGQECIVFHYNNVLKYPENWTCYTNKNNTLSRISSFLLGYPELLDKMIHSGYSNTYQNRSDNDGRWIPDLIAGLSTSQVRAQTVWEAIWLDARGQPRRSPLVIMERDSDAPRGGPSSQSYMQTLCNCLLPHYQRGQVRCRIMRAFIPHERCARCPRSTPHYHH